MMESSDQCAYDGSLDPNDSSSGAERTGLQIVARYEDYAREGIQLNQGDDEQVVGYLDEENATLVLQSQGIELDGKRLILTQGSGGDEIIVIVSSDQDPSVEHSFAESVAGHSPDDHTLEIECESNNIEAIEETQGIEVIETNDGIQNIDKNGTVYVDQAHEFAYVDTENNNYSSEALGNAIYHVQDKDDTTEMVFIPTTSQVITTGNNTRLLHLADVAHSEWATSELQVKDDTECTRKMSEGSVIVSQICVDSDSHSIQVEDSDSHSVNVEDSDSHSVKGEDSAITVVNEQDDSNSLHDESMSAEIETSSPAVAESSSLLSVPPRDINNAVSVIHATSSTLVHDQDWRTKIIQEEAKQAEETDQTNTTLPEVSTNVTDLECSNLKDPLDPELSLQSPLIEESSNHSHLKDTIYSSNKDDNVSDEASATVEEPIDEDTNESIPFPPHLPCENIDEDDSKQKDEISCNDNDSNTSMDVDQSQNLDSKISDPTSNNCKNEMHFTNSEEACSEIQSYRKRTFLSPRDNSESKSSFFSDNSQSKDHKKRKLKKLKSIRPSKVKRAIDEYDFENSSSNLDQELSHNSSLDGKGSNMANSDEISTEVDAPKVSESVNSDVEILTGNLTFQGALTPVTEKQDEKQVESQNSETNYDNSQDLFDHSQDIEENNSSKMLKNSSIKFFKNKQNTVSSEINHTEGDKNPEENILAVNKGNNIDSKSKENDNVVLNMVTVEETTVKPPQRTYVRKRKISDSDRNIELFSLDDLSDPKDEISSYLNPKIFSSDNQNDNNLNDENNLADEDGYVNLMPSDLNKRMKAKGISPMEEKRTRSLRPRASDHLDKTPDPAMDAEDSVSACWGAYLMEASFKPTNTEKTEVDVIKESSTDVPKPDSPKSPIKKRVRIPSHKKIISKGESSKSVQQWDKLIKSSPAKMKDASSDKRKIRLKVKKQVQKTLRNSENLGSSLMPQRKKGRLIKDGKRFKTFLHASSPSTSETVKTCGIKFLNDKSAEKNNSSAIDDFSIASTSTQDLKNFQYTCSNCSNFVSNKVNNLIIHMKYCTVKPSPDMIDYRIDDMGKRQRIRGDDESYSPVGKTSTSQIFSNGSVIDDDIEEQEDLSPTEEGLSLENGEEYEKEDDEDNQEDELIQNSIDNKKKFGYSENDIVWAIVRNRNWPAFVHKIDDKKLEIYVIDYPVKSETGFANVHMNVSIDSVPDNLHSFDDAKWHRNILKESSELPDNDLFVKAVQKSESYVKKRLLYKKVLDGYSFFNIGENVDIAEVMKDEESCKKNEEYDEQVIDIKDLMECIFEGKCDDHVIEVYNGNIPSERHNLHRDKSKEASRRLKNMSWFGPFKNNSQMQIRLHDYFIKLFKSKFGSRKKDMISYIYEVWIPEGIIKAISIKKRITPSEAQIIFYKQDMTSLDMEDFELDCEDS